MTNDTIIASIPKNSRETLRITLGQYEGYDLLNLRVWFRQNADDEERPSRAGFAVRVHLIPQLIEALKDAEADALRRGLFRKENDHGA